MVEPDPESRLSTRLLFAVSDTGIGIPGHMRERIFDSFSQAEPSTSRKYGGTGLGLTICKRLVEMMGGRIWVESEEGEGSVFFFTIALGLDVSQEQPLDVPVARDEEAEVIRPLRILLAEDNEFNRILVQGYLEQTPHSLDMAVNGVDAVALFEHGDYDLALMDMQMPEMDGYEATRIMRDMEAARGGGNIPILALTAYALPAEVAKCIAAGCDGHLAKPIKRASFLKAIAHYARGRAAERQTAPTSPAEIAPPAAPETASAPLPDGDDLVVTLDPDFYELAPMYLDSIRADAQTMRQALTQGQYETVRSLGHQCKGTGGSYGFDRVTILGAELEKAGVAQDLVTARSLLDQLDDYLARVTLAQGEPLE